METLHTSDEDFSECKNEMRADMAQSALAPFIEDDPHAETEQFIRDLLTNLHHLCDRKGLDFDSLLERAKGMYGEETNTAPDRDSDCGPKCALDDEGKANLIDAVAAEAYPAEPMSSKGGGK